MEVVLVLAVLHVYDDLVGEIINFLILWLKVILSVNPIVQY